MGGASNQAAIQSYYTPQSSPNKRLGHSDGVSSSPLPAAQHVSSDATVGDGFTEEELRAALDHSNSTTEVYFTITATPYECVVLTQDRHGFHPPNTEMYLWRRSRLDLKL